MALSKDASIVAVQSALGALSQVYVNSATESDLYEAALLAEAVRAARDANGEVILTNDGFRRSKSIIFRRSPGNLWNSKFTYAKVNFSPTRVLEIHLGIFVLASSGVPHECDVAVLEHEEAERSRQANVHPRASKLIAAIEAKNYSSPPGLNVGRSFLGLSAEMGQGRSFLAFPSGHAKSVQTLLAKRSSECFSGVLPASSDADGLRKHIEQKIKNWVVQG